jgi:hypothetical protein
MTMMTFSIFIKFSIRRFIIWIRKYLQSYFY